MEPKPVLATMLKIERVSVMLLMIVTKTGTGIGTETEIETEIAGERKRWTDLAPIPHVRVWVSWTDIDANHAKSWTWSQHVNEEHDLVIENENGELLAM